MDVRKLKELCLETLPLIDQVDYSKPTPKSLLRAVLEETIKLVEDGVNAKDIMFTTIEMVGLVKRVNETQAKKFKADHYTETEKLLREVNKLKQEQGEDSSGYILELADTGESGGAKNKKHHFIRIAEIDKKPSNEINKNSVAIHYEAVQLPSPYWFVKPFMSIELTSWRLFLFLLIPMLIIAVGITLFLQSIITPTNTELIYFLAFVAAVSFFGYSILPFYEAHLLRIDIAPQWMMKFRQVSAQIESVKLKKHRENGRPYRKLEFVIYEGKCPICNSVVDVEKGKGLYKGRLIGNCSEAPREHRFSFDHVTKSGNYLN